jgi:hypothetical protein
MMMPETHPATGRVHLLNFPADTLARARRRYDVRFDETPGIAVMHDVVSHPYYDCLYDLGGNRIEESRRVNIPKDLATPHVLERDEKSSAATEPRTIDVPVDLDIVEAPVLFVGSIWPHYGHYIIDGMSRFWALDQAPSLPLLMQSRPPVRDHSQAYITQIHDRLDLGSRSVISPDRPTLFRTVHVVRPAFLHTFRAYKCHQTPHLKVASSILSEPDNENFPKRLYLTRSLLKSHERSAAEELHMEEKLRKNGFAVIAPERIPFPDQVRLFNNADWVVGTIGSALHTSLFTKHPAERRFFILCWEKINPRYLMIDEIKDLDSTYLNCMKIASVDARERISETLLDTDLALAELDAAGAFR